MSHQLQDSISLELGRCIAEKLRHRPELLQIAHQNLERWSDLNADAPSLLRCYTEWRNILDQPLEKICELLISESEEAQRLRQNSPFAGILSPREVWEIKQRFRHATSTA